MICILVILLISLATLNVVNHISVYQLAKIVEKKTCNYP